ISGRAPRGTPLTRRSILRTLRPRAAASHWSSVSGVATRVSSRTMPRLLGSESPARRATRRRFAEQLQGLMQALLERPVGPGGGSCAVDRLARLARSHPEPAKSLIGPCPHIRHLRTRNLTIARAIRMQEPEPRGQVTVNDEPALMNGSVVRTAQEHQVCGAVIHAFGAWAKVMDITVAIAATRNHAAPIATPDQTSHLGRNVLRGPPSTRI